MSTIKKIEEQTKATQDAALATQASAEATRAQVELARKQMETEMHRERARVQVYPQPISVEEQDGEFFNINTCIELTNVGQSKAYMTFSAGRFVVVPSGLWLLPVADPDECEPRTKTVEPSSNPVYVPFLFDAPYPDFGRFAEEIAKGDLAAFLYGVVQYENMGIEGTVNFGCIWTIDTSDRNFTPASLGELITNGTWETSLRIASKYFNTSQQPN